MIPLGTYEPADFPWFKLGAFAALLVTAGCFVLQLIRALAGK